MQNCQSDDALEISSAIEYWFQKKTEEFGFEMKPYQVNCGMCDELAQFVEEEVQGAETICIEDEFPTLKHISHYAIRFRGRYYDAETPCGVDDVKDLPIVKNYGNTEYHKMMADACRW